MFKIKVQSLSAVVTVFVTVFLAVIAVRRTVAGHREEYLGREMTIAAITSVENAAARTSTQKTHETSISIPSHKDNLESQRIVHARKHHVVQVCSLQCRNGPRGRSVLPASRSRRA